MKKVSQLENEESLLEHLRSEIFLAGTGDLKIPKSRIYNLFLLQNDFSWTSKESHFEAGKPLLGRFGPILLSAGATENSPRQVFY